MPEMPAPTTRTSKCSFVTTAYPLLPAPICQRPGDATLRGDFEGCVVRGLQSPVVDLDLKSAANVQDPFPLYTYLRDRDPVHWSESLNAWVVTRYDDVVEVFDRPETFSSDRFRKIDERYASKRPAVRAVADVLGQWLVFRDPPDHDRLRELLQRSFTPKQLESSRDRVQAT